MTRNQMTQMLSETIRVSTTEAGAALEARNWNILEAAQLLQRQQRARRLEAARPAPSRSVVRDIIAWFRSGPTDLTAATMAPLFLMRSAYQFGHL